MIAMRKVAAFDFDGTLTKKDSLPLFMRHALGNRAFYYAVLKNSFWISVYLMRLYPNWKAKQRLFASCFKGMEESKFSALGVSFATKYPDLLRTEAIQSLEKHLAERDKVYIVTASMEVWVKPLLASYPSLTYLTTIPEVIDGKLSGRFASPNCHGKEKTIRLLTAEPQRDEYLLYAYGDSSGDRELLAMADYPFYRKFQ